MTPEEYQVEQDALAGQAQWEAEQAAAEYAAQQDADRESYEQSALGG